MYYTVGYGKYYEMKNGEILIRVRKLSADLIRSSYIRLTNKLRHGGDVVVAIYPLALPISIEEVWPVSSVKRLLKKLPEASEHIRFKLAIEEGVYNWIQSKIELLFTYFGLGAFRFNVHVEDGKVVIDNIRALTITGDRLEITGKCTLWVEKLGDTWLGKIKFDIERVS
ncbi:MAG: hypothetical protein B6U76_01430 [Desulfurococcales archaeon ex4484_217_2]|nr:MAG: hypothetical protein B6U76_01430 [Desulfurococcales archaeon ex4484_217_2]